VELPGKATSGEEERPRMSFGLTFDTGALIALERRRQRMARIYTTAVADGLLVTVPAVVLTEWWRGRSDVAETLLCGLRVELVDAELGKLAGEALAAIQGATAVDAIVMASAARRGDVVYTSDVDDLDRLREYFPGVRVLGV
jgi:predicted nucleic acid-binding protein